tara:strand:+ start:675 stop:1439 length:765 start_codon:yes stop_codon:yes gene_type:complete
MLKILSWNVNGIRAILKKGFGDFLSDHAPDVLCLQETKISDHQIPREFFEGFHQYWNCAERPGYSGTAILTKEAPLEVYYNFPDGMHSNEGRLITLEFPKFFVSNVYVPNAQAGLKRLDYRSNAWDRAFCDYLQGLKEQKPVLVCGDFNVAHQEIDLTHPKANRENPGFTDQERSGFDAILNAGYVDTFRHLYPDLPEQYSWWSYRAGARVRNVGWRIDYCLLSEEWVDKLQSAFILDDVMGSDHAPVGVLLKG